MKVIWEGYCSAWMVDIWRDTRKNISNGNNNKHNQAIKKTRKVITTIKYTHKHMPVSSSMTIHNKSQHTHIKSHHIECEQAGKKFKGIQPEISPIEFWYVCCCNHRRRRRRRHHRLSEHWMADCMHMSSYGCERKREQEQSVNQAKSSSCSTSITVSDHQRCIKIMLNLKNSLIDKIEITLTINHVTNDTHTHIYMCESCTVLHNVSLICIGCIRQWYALC